MNELQDSPKAEAEVNQLVDQMAEVLQVSLMAVRRRAPVVSLHVVLELLDQVREYDAKQKE